MFLLNRVVGPWRRRRARPPLPPPLTAEETARRLFSLPISYWTYDFEPGVRHLGPMSQDFVGAFGLGNTNRKIHMVDANGVAVVAIQVLNRRLTALQREVTRLSALLEGRVGEPTSDVSAGRQPAAASGGTVSASPGRGPGRAEGTRAMTDRTPPTADNEEDVQGHKFYSSSDRDIKHEVTPVVSEEQAAEDVAGHRIYNTSDRSTKHEVTPIVSEEQAD
jgi:hypothetical protein